jgi:hypothetical protein
MIREIWFIISNSYFAGDKLLFPSMVAKAEFYFTNYEIRL